MNFFNTWSQSNNTADASNDEKAIYYIVLLISCIAWTCCLATISSGIVGYLIGKDCKKKADRKTYKALTDDKSEDDEKTPLVIEEQVDKLGPNHDEIITTLKQSLKNLSMFQPKSQFDIANKTEENNLEFYK